MHVAPLDHGIGPAPDGLCNGTPLGLGVALQRLHELQDAIVLPLIPHMAIPVARGGP